MKKLISVLLSTATVFSLALLPVSATSIPEVESAAILEQPQLTNEDAHVLTMEMFNEAFTRDDVINILAADKANGMASTYATCQSQSPKLRFRNSMQKSRQSLPEPRP